MRINGAIIGGSMTWECEHGRPGGHYGGCRECQRREDERAQQDTEGGASDGQDEQE